MTRWSSRFATARIAICNFSAAARLFIATSRNSVADFVNSADLAPSTD